MTVKELKALLADVPEDAIIVRIHRAVPGYTRIQPPRRAKAAKHDSGFLGLADDGTDVDVVIFE